MNVVILSGRVVRDPELRYTANGVPVCSFPIAVERSYLNAQGERNVDYPVVVFWRGMAEKLVAPHAKKGMKVMVKGTLQTKIRERDGIKYQETEVHCDSFEFCESRRYDEPSNSNQSNTYNNMDSDDSGFVPVDDFDDELPF